MGVLSAMAAVLFLLLIFQFFMNSALTPFPAQQTCQIISNLPTQDRHLHATLCASGFFSLFF